MSRPADLVYVNMDLSADAQSPPQHVRLFEQRIGGIVDRASNFRMSIIRWSSFGLDLPLFIPPIQIHQSNPNLTVLSFRLLDDKAGSAEANVVWAPQFKDEPVPPPPIAQQYVQSKFYWAQDYRHVVNLFNTALQTAANQLSLAEAPGVSYSTETGKFEIMIPAGVQVFLNRPLQNLLDYFDFEYFADGFARVRADNGGIARQMRPSTDFWSPIGSIVFTSQMPVRYEEASQPIKLGSSDFAPDASRAFDNLLTDMSLTFEGGASDALGAISFYPSAQNRYADLTSNDPLTQLSFNLYWKNRHDSTLNPVYLKPRGSVSVKILLQRKDV